MSFLILILIAQAVVGICVMLVLKVLLHRMLVDLAARAVEVYRLDEHSTAPEKIVIISHRPLSTAVHERMERAVQKNFKVSVKVEFRLIPGIWGGAILHIGEQILDFSLRDRLARAF